MDISSSTKVNFSTMSMKKENICSGKAKRLAKRRNCRGLGEFYNSPRY